MKTPARLFPFLLLLSMVSALSAQTVNFTASNISVGGTKLASGKLCFTPVDIANHPLSASAMGGTSGGALTYASQCVNVTNGAISSTPVPDSALSTPANLCQRVTITDSTSNNRVIYTAPCVQPASANQTSWCTTVTGTTTCNFDRYTPAVAAIAPVIAPTLGIGTVTTGSPGGAASASINGATPNYTLNLTIPAGAAGAAGIGSDPACHADGSGHLSCLSAAISAAVADAARIAVWGDSLSQGYQGTGANGVTTGDYPQILQNLMGTRIANNGVSGNTSTQIAVRSGAVATTATVSGGAIPACALIPCVGVTVTFTSGAEPVTSLGPFYGTPGTISGIHGYVTQSGGVDTFTPDVITSGATVASAAFVVDKPFSAYLPVIWSGRNNFADPTTVQSDIAAMVAARATGQSYLVLSVINGDLTGEWSGGTAYNQIAALNSALASTYGTNFLDVRASLVAAYNPLLPVDVSDHGHDIPPTSLHAIAGAGTLTQDINTTDTSFTVSISAGNAAVGNIAVIDSEAMRITAISGSTWTVTRNYGGTLASHTNGTALTSTDFLHLNANGYRVVAEAIQAKLLSLGYPFNQALTQASAAATSRAVNVSTFSGGNTSTGESAMTPSQAWGIGNTANGFFALRSVTSGLGNTALGYNAGVLVTTGSKNVLLGRYAGQAIVSSFSNTIVGDFTGAFASGNANTFLGASAGVNNTATENTFVGYQAGTANTSGNGVFVGALAGAANTTGIANTCIGFSCLAASVTGSSNTAVGYQALMSSNGASTATAVGTNALQNMTATGNVDNTAIGHQALINLTTGVSDTCTGYNCLGAEVTGNFNVATGTAAGRLATTSSNTFIGALSGFDETTGANNTFVGFNAGTNASPVMATNTQSTYVGSGANASTNGQTNSTAIGYTAQTTASNQVVIGNSSVTDVYLGSASGLANIHAANVGTNTTILNWQGALTSFTGTGADATQYTYTMPANTMAAGTGIRVTFFFKQTTATSASKNYKITFGGSNASWNSTLTTTGNGSKIEFIIMNNPGVTNANQMLCGQNNVGSSTIACTPVTTAVDTTSSVVITAVVNMANTEALTPLGFMVQAIK